MNDLANKAEAAEDRFWNRDVVGVLYDAIVAQDDAESYTLPALDRRPDRTDGLLVAVLFGCIGAFAGAIANPDRWEVPAFALFAAFVVVLFGKNVDI